MSRIAFIFPGQGAQKTGMAQEFYDQTAAGREVFEKASQILDMDMAKLCFEENPRLDITEYTQPAMVTASLAMMKVMNEEGLYPDVTAGLSLGEYCALVACSRMKAEDAIAIVRKRGILMQEAVPQGLGSMAAVLALDTDKIEEVLSKIDGVQIANYNCPGQIVISGRTQAVEEAGVKLKEAGAKRVIALNVSGPFHSSMLEDAGKRLYTELDGISLSDSDIPYVSNVTAEYVRDSEKVKPLLMKQVYSSVKWQQSVETMLADGVDTFIEIGPGKTLSGFIKKINRDVRVLNVEKRKDIEAVKEAVLC